MKATNCICDQCGERFYKRPDQIRDTKNNFCSQRCFGDFLSIHQKGIPRPCVRGAKPHLQKRERKTCLVCGAVFDVKVSHASRRKFCSYPCRLKHLKEHPECYPKGIPPRKPPKKIIIKQCRQCGKSFDAKNKNIKHCSQECVLEYRRTSSSGENNPNWLGGPINYYGDNWRQQKRKALARDKVCQICGHEPKKRERKLDVHHIIPFRVFGIERYEEANHLDNLICYCRSCHAKIEKHVHDNTTGLFSTFKP